MPYDAYGNLTSLTKPERHKGQRMRYDYKRNEENIFCLYFMVLPFLIACNENHSFSLDESRQLLIVHNFLRFKTTYLTL